MKKGNTIKVIAICVIGIFASWVGTTSVPIITAICVVAAFAVIVWACALAMAEEALEKEEQREWKELEREKVFEDNRREIYRSLREFKFNHRPIPYIDLPIFASGNSGGVRFQTKPDLTPCFYCKRYDQKVNWYDEPKWQGRYHPWCRSRVINEVILELANRMTSHA